MFISPYYGADTLLGAGDTTVNKADFCPYGVDMLVGEQKTGK